MDELKKELEALEAIENTPVPPKLLPPVLSQKEAVKIPLPLAEYLQGIDQMPELDNDGRIPIEKYLEILEEHKLTFTWKPVLRLVKVDTENINNH